MTTGRTERILLISAAGLDWTGARAAMADGRMPVLAALRQRGASGALAGAHALPGPAAPASLASGVLPDRHGLWMAEEPWAGGLRPAGAASWRAAPLWARLAQAGVASASAGWPASRAGADWAGEHVDDAFAEPSGATWDDWALPPRACPPALREEMRARRVHPADIDGAMLRPLVPAFDRIDQERERRLVELALPMAEAASVQAAAASLIARGPAAMFVHLAWLGKVRDRFEDAAAPFDQAAPQAWRFLDGLIGRLAALAGSDCLVVIASAGWRERAGIIIAAGPEVTAGAPIEGAALLDIAPTLAARLGFAAPDLPGRVLAELARDGARPLPLAEPAPIVEAEQALVDQVGAAGYALPPPPSGTWQARRLARLAEIVLTRAPAQAAKLARQALAHSADDAAALSIAAAAHVALGESEPLPAIADALARVAPDRAWASLVRGAYHALRGEAAAARPHLLIVEACDESETRLRAGAAWLVLERPIDAARAFTAALALAPDTVGALTGLASAALMRNRTADAELALRRALALDPVHRPAWTMLRDLLASQGRGGEAGRADAAVARLGGAPAATGSGTA